MNTYIILKHLHVTFAVLSLLGFSLRGFWMLKESPMLQKKPVRILPHINDSLLLLTAIMLAILTGFYPFVVGWVTLKVLLLVVYIVLGIFALKRGKTKQARTVFFFAALATILAIFAIAGIKPGF
ncbi:MAG: SirB2 family protein [Pseudomonadales bacterium]|nr:SirB2 family protein [Pseudomonadales bacterium]